MTTINMKIGPCFLGELKVSGLLERDISWTENAVSFQGLSDQDEAILDTVIQNHDPNKIDQESITLAIKAEAQRRINSLFGETDLQASLIKQMNTQKRATSLLFKQVSGQTLSTEEQAEMLTLDQLGETIDAIREASNQLELSLPEDFTNDQYWPSSA